MIDTSNWRLVGRSVNADYFEIEPRVLGGVAHQGARDTLETARENVALLHDYFRQAGPGHMIYFIDRMSDQTSGARSVYRDETLPELALCVTLLVGSALSRAIAAFFTGLSRPRMPLRVMTDLDQALEWGRQVRAEHDARSQ